jgi:hypothetical protein
VHIWEWGHTDYNLVFHIQGIVMQTMRKQMHQYGMFSLPWIEGELHIVNIDY